MMHRAVNQKRQNSLNEWMMKFIKEKSNILTFTNKGILPTIKVDFMVFPFYILPIVAVFHLTFFNES